jgi:hypothetical protein
MMWRGAVFSSLLHGGLLIGVIGGLPILPSIFNRSIETDSTGLQIAVEVVSESALGQMPDVAGLRNTAPDAETVVPLPRRVIGALKPAPSTQPPSPDSPRQTPPSPPSSVASQTPPPVSPEMQTVSREMQNSDAQRMAGQNRPAAATVVIVPVTPDTPPTPSGLPPAPQPEPQRRARTTPAPATEASTTQNTFQAAPREASSGSADNEFVAAVSGRKRNLVVDLLEADPRLRRAVTQGSENVDMPYSGTPLPVRTGRVRTRTVQSCRQIPAWRGTAERHGHGAEMADAVR